MGCNSLIRAFIFRILNYVSAPKPCNSVGLHFRTLHSAFYFPHLYQLLVIRRVWQDKIELSPLIFKITYTRNQHTSFTHAPLRVILSRCLTNSNGHVPRTWRYSSTVAFKTNHHSPLDTKIIDPRCRLRIHDLDPRLSPTKNDDSPFECARILPTSCLLCQSDVPSHVPFTSNE